MKWTTDKISYDELLESNVRYCDVRDETGAVVAIARGATRAQAVDRARLIARLPELWRAVFGGDAK